MVKVLGVEVEPTVMKEPVLDVPAIDMTDAAKPQADSGTGRQPKQAAGAKTTRRKARKARLPKRDRSVRPNAKSADRSTSRPVKADETKRTRDGSISRETFQQVE